MQTIAECAHCNSSGYKAIFTDPRAISASLVLPRRQAMLNRNTNVRYLATIEMPALPWSLGRNNASPRSSVATRLNLP